MDALCHSGVLAGLRGQCQCEKQIDAVKKVKMIVNKYLDLHSDFSSVLQHPVVHLANGRCSERLLLKGLQLVSPAWSQFLLQHFLYKLNPQMRFRTMFMSRAEHKLFLHKTATLTFICHEGMKSALCRTLSKIFCSCGLMNVLSRTIGNNKERDDMQKTLPVDSVTKRHQRAKLHKRFCCIAHLEC